MIIKIDLNICGPSMKMNKKRAALSYSFFLFLNNRIAKVIIKNEIVKNARVKNTSK